MSKLILRTTSGETHELTFRLTKTVGELRQHIVDKYKYSPKLRLIHNSLCLNDFLERSYALSFLCRLSHCGLTEPAELIVTNHMHKTVFGTL